MYAGEIDKSIDLAKEIINENEIHISAVVRLELQYLYEIQRVTDGANQMIIDLLGRIGLKMCDKSFNTIISGALDSSWTRDPFDRIIVANAALNENVLVTKDKNILEHYENAEW